MAVGDKQKLITQIVGTVLNERPITDAKFDWFINKHSKENFGESFNVIDKIFRQLNGDISANQNKRSVKLECDAYFGGQHNFIFEFDEYQHFSSSRLLTFGLYPKGLELNFSLDQWVKECKNNKVEADKYRRAKTTTDFNFEGGRTAQRAYLDCFRDLLPKHHDLNPTLRINEFEVEGITSHNKEACKKVEQLINSKLK